MSFTQEGKEAQKAEPRPHSWGAPEPGLQTRSVPSDPRAWVVQPQAVLLLGELGGYVVIK